MLIVLFPFSNSFVFTLTLLPPSSLPSITFPSIFSCLLFLFAFLVTLRNANDANGNLEVSSSGFGELPHAVDANATSDKRKTDVDIVRGVPSCSVQEAICGYIGSSTVQCDVLGWRQFVYIRTSEPSPGYGYRCLEWKVDAFAEMVLWDSVRCARI